MKIKYILYPLKILCLLQLSYGQNRQIGQTRQIGQNGQNGQSGINNNSPKALNQEAEENTPPVQENNAPQMPSNEFPQTLPNGEETNINTSAIIETKDLPTSINDYLIGYKNFTESYKTKIEEEEKKANYKGNLHCIKALLSTIHFPLRFKNAQQYYDTICNENTKIEPLIFLQGIIKYKSDICSENGNNYKTAYNIIRARHLLNCMKDIESGKYCYQTNNTFYNQLVDEEIENAKKRVNNNNEYWSSVRNQCNNIKDIDTIPFCSKIAIFGNKITNKLLKENITLEIYYHGNKTYKLDLIPSLSIDENNSIKPEMIDEKCHADRIHEGLKEVDNLDVKILLEIYKNGGLSLYKNIINILTITMMISIAFMFM